VGNLRRGWPTKEKKRGKKKELVGSARVAEEEKKNPRRRTTELSDYPCHTKTKKMKRVEKPRKIEGKK